MNDDHTELFQNSVSVPKLIYWATLGNLEQVKETLRNEPDVNITDSEGYTALHGASENGHSDVVRFLISEGEEINPILNNSTPLDLATKAGKTEVINILIEHGGVRKST